MLQKNFDILAASLYFQRNIMLQQNYFQLCIQQNFQSFSKIVPSVHML